MNVAEPTSTTPEPTPHAETEPSRLCTICGQRLPITEFRLQRSDGEDRHPECNRCRNMVSTRTRRRERIRRMGTHLNKIRKLEQIEDVHGAVNAMITSLGGTNKFCDLLAFWMEADPTAGSRAKGFAAILQAISVAHQTEPELRIEEMRAAKTLDELGPEEQWTLLGVLVEQHSEFVAELLREAGWKCTRLRRR